MNYHYLALLCLFFIHSMQAAESEALLCYICHDNLYDKHQSATILPCFPGHAFHTACINQWYRQSRSCPVCSATMPINKDQQTIVSLEKRLNLASVSLHGIGSDLRRIQHLQTTVEYLQQKHATNEREKQALEGQLNTIRIIERRKHKRLCSGDMLLGGLLGGATVFSIAISTLILHVYGYI